MKLSKFLAALAYAVLLVNISCTSEKDRPIDNNQVKEDAFSLYEALSEKPTVSALDISLGSISRTGLNEVSLGLTTEDISYITSLNQDELTILRERIMKQWNIESMEQAHEILEQVYDEASDGMSAEEQIALNEFIDEYMDVACGTASLEKLSIFKENKISPQNTKCCVHAAVGIDKFGRNFYETTMGSNIKPLIKPTEKQCKDTFRAKIALASCATAWSTWIGILTGGASSVATYLINATACVEAIAAWQEYMRCLEHARS